MIGLVKLALVNGLKHHLHLTDERFWGPLVEDSDGEVHVIRDLDLEGAVLTRNDFLFMDICIGWLDMAASLTFLTCQSFRIDFVVDIFWRVTTSSVLVKKALKKVLG